MADRPRHAGDRALGQIDRKTVRRYVAVAHAVGLSPSEGPEALTDEALGAVVELVRPGRRPGGHGRAWEILSAHRALLEDKLDPDVDLTLTKISPRTHRGGGELSLRLRW